MGEENELLVKLLAGTVTPQKQGQRLFGEQVELTDQLRQFQVGLQVKTGVEVLGC